MRVRNTKKWLLCFASGGFMLQAAGCDATQFQTLLLSTVEGLVNEVIGLFIGAGISALFNV